MKFKVSRKNLIIFLAVLIFLIGWNFMTYKIGADRLVEMVGVGNGYLVVSLVALFGGLSSFTSPSFISVLGTFSAGGLNPVLLGAAAGIALFLGDSFFYYFGKKGGEALNAPLRKKLRIFSRFIKKQPRWAVTLLVYGYFSFAPLPNDIITFPLGLAGYPFKKIWVPAVLGDITFVIWVSFLFV